jgi:hypothetical protein
VRSDSDVLEPACNSLFSVGEVKRRLPTQLSRNGVRHRLPQPSGRAGANPSEDGGIFVRFAERDMEKPPPPIANTRRTTPDAAIRSPWPCAFDSPPKGAPGKAAAVGWQQPARNVRSGRFSERAVA